MSEIHDQVKKIVVDHSELMNLKLFQKRSL